MNIISTEKSPAAIGPYSQGVRHGNMLFISGQIAIDPDRNRIQKTDIHGQTKQVLKNIENILLEANTEISCLLKTVIFLKDMKYFESVNKIYSEWLGAARPSRSTVAVLDLPKGALIEIECIAAIPNNELSY